MRSSLDYAGFAQLCARSPIMRKIMRAHNRIIQRSLLHGTALAVYQSESLEKSPVLPPIKLDRSSKAQTLCDTVECPKLTCRKPEPEKRKSECRLGPSTPATEKCRKTDMAWIIGCFNFEDDIVKVTSNAPGTWGAFNSLLSSSCDKTNVGLVPPLIRSPRQNMIRCIRVS